MVRCLTGSDITLFGLNAIKHKATTITINLKDLFIKYTPPNKFPFSPPLLIKSNEGGVLSVSLKGQG